MVDAINTLRTMRDDGAKYAALAAYFREHLEDSACPRTYHDAEEIIAQAADTAADWTDAIDLLGERAVGNYVADWADETAYHPWLSEGAAYLATSDQGGVVTRWHDDGRVDTYVCASWRDAEAEITEAQDAWGDEEEEEEEEENAE